MSAKGLSLIALSMLGGSLYLSPFVRATEPEVTTVLHDIAQDIESLKQDFPQLVNFSAKTAIATQNQTAISYHFNTLDPDSRAGWRAGVPSPDKNGVWFHLSFFPPDSDLQIHMQPMVHAPMCIGEMKVQLLLREGENTQSLNGAIWEILRNYGVTECPAS